MEGYCVRCKSKQEMVNEKHSTSKNGRSMVKGECKKCGCKMCVFTASKK